MRVQLITSKPNKMDLTLYCHEDPKQKDETMEEDGYTKRREENPLEP